MMGTRSLLPCCLISSRSKIIQVMSAHCSQSGLAEDEEMRDDEGEEGAEAMEDEERYDTHINPPHVSSFRLISRPPEKRERQPVTCACNYQLKWRQGAAISQG